MVCVPSVNRHRYTRRTAAVCRGAAVAPGGSNGTPESCLFIQASISCSRPTFRDFQRLSNCIHCDEKILPKPLVSFKNFGNSYSTACTTNPCAPTTTELGAAFSPCLFTLLFQLACFLSKFNAPPSRCVACASFFISATHASLHHQCAPRVPPSPLLPSNPSHRWPPLSMPHPSHRTLLSHTVPASPTLRPISCLTYPVPSALPHLSRHLH